MRTWHQWWYQDVLMNTTFNLMEGIGSQGGSVSNKNCRDDLTVMELKPLADVW